MKFKVSKKKCTFCFSRIIYYHSCCSYGKRIECKCYSKLTKRTRYISWTSTSIYRKRYTIKCSSQHITVRKQKIKLNLIKKKNCFQYSRADKNALQQQYDTIIADVNQRVSDKSTLQINLNETRDTVRETNQDVSYEK